MPRKLRVEYPGAPYHVRSRANGTGVLFQTDVDRQDFLKTPAEACVKTGRQVHAYCLLRTHFQLVVETPRGNLVAGMRWLLSAYTLRYLDAAVDRGSVTSGNLEEPQREAASVAKSPRKRQQPGWTLV
jgi:putative transposase